MRILKYSILLIVATSLFAVPAMADNIAISRGGGLFLSVTTTLTGTAISGASQPNTLSFYVGAYNITNTTTGDPTVVGYCVDLTKAIQPSLPNTYQGSISYNLSAWNLDVGVGNNTDKGVPDAGIGAAWLLKAFTGWANTDAKKAALQMAIWEWLYDDGSRTTGALIVTTTGDFATAFDDLTALISSAGGIPTTGHQAYWVQTVDNDDRGVQDFGYVVPEPTALLLLGSGLLGVGLFRRFRS